MRERRLSSYQKVHEFLVPTASLVNRYTKEDSARDLSNYNLVNQDLNRHMLLRRTVLWDQNTGPTGLEGTFAPTSPNRFVPGGDSAAPREILLTIEEIEAKEPIIEERTPAAEEEEQGAPNGSADAANTTTAAEQGGVEQALPPPEVKITAPSGAPAAATGSPSDTIPEHEALGGAPEPTEGNIHVFSCAILDFERRNESPLPVTPTHPASGGPPIAPRSLQRKLSVGASSGELVQLQKGVIRSPSARFGNKNSAGGTGAGPAPPDGETVVQLLFDGKSLILQDLEGRVLARGLVTPEGDGQLHTFYHWVQWKNTIEDPDTLTQVYGVRKSGDIEFPCRAEVEEEAVISRVHSGVSSMMVARTIAANFYFLCYLFLTGLLVLPFLVRSLSFKADAEFQLLRRQWAAKRDTLLRSSGVMNGSSRLLVDKHSVVQPKGSNKILLPENALSVNSIPNSLVDQPRARLQSEDGGASLLNWRNRKTQSATSKSALRRVTLKHRKTMTRFAWREQDAMQEQLRRVWWWSQMLLAVMHCGFALQRWRIRDAFLRNDRNDDPIVVSLPGILHGDASFLAELGRQKTQADVKVMILPTCIPIGLDALTSLIAAVGVLALIFRIEDRGILRKQSPGKELEAISQADARGFSRKITDERKQSRWTTKGRETRRGRFTTNSPRGSPQSGENFDNRDGSPTSSTEGKAVATPSRRTRKRDTTATPTRGNGPTKFILNDRNRNTHQQDRDMSSDEKEDAVAPLIHSSSAASSAASSLYQLGRAGGLPQDSSPITTHGAKSQHPCCTAGTTCFACLQMLAFFSAFMLLFFAVWMPHILEAEFDGGTKEDLEGNNYGSPHALLASMDSLQLQGRQSLSQSLMTVLLGVNPYYNSNFIQYADIISWKRRFFSRDFAVWPALGRQAPTSPTHPSGSPDSEPAEVVRKPRRIPTFTGADDPRKTHLLSNEKKSDLTKSALKVPGTTPPALGPSPKSVMFDSGEESEMLSADVENAEEASMGKSTSTSNTTEVVRTLSEGRVPSLGGARLEEYPGRSGKRASTGPQLAASLEQLESGVTSRPHFGRTGSALSASEPNLSQPQALMFRNRNGTSFGAALGQHLPRGPRPSSSALAQPPLQPTLSRRNSTATQLSLPGVKNRSKPLPPRDTVPYAGAFVNAGQLVPATGGNSVSNRAGGRPAQGSHSSRRDGTPLTSTRLLRRLRRVVVENLRDEEMFSADFFLRHQANAQESSGLAQLLNGLQSWLQVLHQLYRKVLGLPPLSWVLFLLFSVRDQDDHLHPSGSQSLTMSEIALFNRLHPECSSAVACRGPGFGLRQRAGSGATGAGTGTHTRCSAASAAGGDYTFDVPAADRSALTPVCPTGSSNAGDLDLRTKIEQANKDVNLGDADAATTAGATRGNPSSSGVWGLSLPSMPWSGFSRSSSSAANAATENKRDAACSPVVDAGSTSAEEQAGKRKENMLDAAELSTPQLGKGPADTEAQLRGCSSQQTGAVRGDNVVGVQQPGGGASAAVDHEAEESKEHFTRTATEDENFLLDQFYEPYPDAGAMLFFLDRSMEFLLLIILVLYAFGKVVNEKFCSCCSCGLYLGYCLLLVQIAFLVYGLLWRFSVLM
ncbi:unnamed protein product [Amoebophrya sp. A120]|nr:unnamed protein product [Amoebophrya sp. A120]|eukprot:GSA120T00003015001.1